MDIMHGLVKSTMSGFVGQKKERSAWGTRLRVSDELTVVMHQSTPGRRKNLAWLPVCWSMWVALMTGLLTEVCYLLEVSWQICHAWITHWTVARAVLTMSRRRSTRDERTHGRDAREPLLARTRAYSAPREPAFGS